MFDDRLKQLREKKGLNAKQAAQQLNLPYTTYLGYEKNDREPNAEILIRISDFFDADTDYLLGLTPCRRKKNYLLINELGLSEKCIDFIKELKANPSSPYILALNAIIEHPSFLSMLNDIVTYKETFANSDLLSADADIFENVLTPKGKKLIDMIVNKKDFIEKTFINQILSDFGHIIESMDFTSELALKSRINQNIKELKQQHKRTVEKQEQLKKIEETLKTDSDAQTLKTAEALQASLKEDIQSLQSKLAETDALQKRLNPEKQH